VCEHEDMDRRQKIVEVTAEALASTTSTPSSPNHHCGHPPDQQKCANFACKDPTSRNGALIISTHFTHAT
jgi:hypothetical protein